MTKQIIKHFHKYFINSAKLLLKPVNIGQRACTINILIKKKNTEAITLFYSQKQILFLRIFNKLLIQRVNRFQLFQIKY